MKNQSLLYSYSLDVYHYFQKQLMKEKLIYISVMVYGIKNTHLTVKQSALQIVAKLSLMI